MPEFKNAVPERTINYAWLFRMAWRDSRKNRSRLLLFISSIVLGIAALVAVYAFRDNLQRDLDNQAKTLTGADLIIESRKEITKPVTAMLDTLGEKRAKEQRFASMVYFVKGNGSRLIQVRALEGDYPFYGSIETTPSSAARTFRSGKQALVDKTLMLQYKAAVGDSIKIGDLHFTIAGSLDGVPGQSGVSSTIAPIVYIPLRYMNQTGLNQVGSRIQYQYYYQLGKTGTAEQLLKRIQPTLNKEGLDHETVATKKASTGRAFADLNKFLALTGFIALLLGCIGVGSAIYVYIHEKLAAIATLRCLGLSAAEAFLIYLIQISFLGLTGAVAGALLGTVVQLGIPMVLKDFIPIEMTMQISWPAIGQGLAIGLLIAILFALPALLNVRNISPLNAIRASFENIEKKRDLLKSLVYLLIGVFVYGFTWLQMGGWLEALAFTGGILLAFAALYLVSRLLMAMLKRAIPERISYLWRQGFANLHRPNNQTLMLTLSIGLSTLFIVSLYLVQDVLLHKVTLSSSASQANMVMFDIQSNQKDEVASMAKAQHLPVLSMVPVVTMRMESINGKTAAALLREDSLASGKDKTDNRGNTALRSLRGEVRATYQEKLTAAEEISDGKWTGSVKPGEAIPVSLERDYASRLNVKIGDKITFNIQGMPMETTIGSIREVNWSRMQTNFRIVFPTGVLEQAPQFYVMMTHVSGEKASAGFQSSVLQRFPNVSAIDLALILKVLDELLSKISFVIRFMAGFSMATGWIVLVSAILSSRAQRMKESVLLRTLGASRKQIMAITALEYFFLGLIATAAGIILAVGGSWAVAHFSLNSAFEPQLLPLLLFFVLIPVFIALTGLYSSRSVLNQPPLEILRKES